VQGAALIFQQTALVVVVLAVVFVGAGEFFEEVGILDWGGDLVVAAGPFSEVDAAAAVGTEGKVFASGEDDGSAGGAAEGFDLRAGSLWHSSFILNPMVWL
jgi:hypothetical protein